MNIIGMYFPKAYMRKRLVDKKAVMARIGSRKEVKGPDLEALASLMLAGEVTDVEAHKALEGKRVNLDNPQKRRYEKKGHRILENGSRLEAWKGGHIEGDMGYSTYMGLNEHHLWINELFVQPEYRNGGIGASLMDHAEKISKREGLDAMYLEVDRANVEGIRFFEKNGFKEVSAVNEFNIDRLIMRMDVMQEGKNHERPKDRI